MLDTPVGVGTHTHDSICAHGYPQNMGMKR